MAISSGLIKRMGASAQTLNTNGGNKSSTQSTSSTTTSSSSKGTTSSKVDTTGVKNLNGVDDATTQKMNSTYNQSSASKSADKTSSKALSNLQSLVSKEDIISKDVWDALDNKFEVPEAVTEADAWLSGQLEKIQSGKTSYSDQVRDMMDKIMNREKFSYDVDTDPLFQQALASAMNSGKQAMQDTIGQASALTGGYGSTYATTAGNQAYNSFIEDAYDNLPQYYQMAREAYQMEGEEMYRQFGMMSELDDKEFNRNLTAYDATFNHRNQLYNESYGQFRDEKSDAFNMANLQLNEHGQKVSDAYNYYSAASNQSDRLYEREYSRWQDSVNQAMQLAQMYNSDYWSQTNFDEGVRQYEKSFAEDVRQFDTSFAEGQRQFNENLAEQKRQHNDQMSYNWASLSKKSGSDGSGGNGNGYDYSAEDMEKASKSKAVSTFKASVLTETEFRRRGKSATIDGKQARFDNYEEYIDAVLGNWNSDKKLTESETAYLVGYYFR